MKNKVLTFIGKALGNLFALSLIYSFVIFVSLPILVPLMTFGADWSVPLLIGVDLMIAILIMNELKARSKRKNSRLH